MSAGSGGSTDTAVAPLTARLRAAAGVTLSAIRNHPFIVELGDGSLDRAAFRFYVVQDGHYLREFSRALTILADRAPSRAVATLLAEHAATTVTVEQSLHATLLAEMPSRPADVADASVAPVTLAYTSYLIATCATGTLLEGVASMLPCYWIYCDVGRELRAHSSPDPLYSRWIDTYAGEEFEQAVTQMLELTDSIGTPRGDAERQSATDRFVTSARYEWMFWDAAYRQLGWPV
ncbi:MAG TPA: thiaminase II [Candidatus Dormibacteraeota bacterium]